MRSLKYSFLFKIIVICSLAIFLAGFLFLAGCSEILAKKEPIQINVDKVYEILKSQKDNYIILDFRTKEEFNSGHLDSALLIPVDELEARYVELTENKPIIVYCKSGRRSAKAAAILISKGFSQVYDMTGGIDAWTIIGYPVIIENSASGTTEASNVSQKTENTITTVDTSDIAEISYITADELYAKLNKSDEIIILDVRSEDSFMIKHIKNAINIPYKDLQGRTGDLDNTKEIIMYCSNFDCGLSKNAVLLLLKAGFKNVVALEGGIESWQDKDYPVE